MKALPDNRLYCMRCIPRNRLYFVLAAIARNTDEDAALSPKPDNKRGQLRRPRPSGADTGKVIPNKRVLIYKYHIVIIHYNLRDRL